MKNYYFHILIFLLLLIYINRIQFYKSRNIQKHRDSQSLYAHFSKIDSFSYYLFPMLLFTHPRKLYLNPGQSLYIPKNWWHWVKTTKKTFAVNYWFTGDVKKPFIFKHTNILDTSTLNDEQVCIWDSEKNKTDKQCDFKTFYNSKKDNSCVITLDDYDLGHANKTFKTNMKQCITFPSSTIQEPSSFDYNIWITSGSHDTGLHYDDEDGILNVIEGQKEIILFPPSDTPYLYKFDTTYKWITKQATDFHYNSFIHIKDIPGISSSQLLYETCKDFPKVLASISKLYTKKDLIWGFKKHNNEYRWEIYDYTLDGLPSITSYDIYEDGIGPKTHYYYNMDETVQLPFWGQGRYKEDEVFYIESAVFVIDTYSSFFINYNTYMKRLGYDDPLSFRDLVLYKYECYELCIHKKNSNEIFIQYLGISLPDFLNFLSTNVYPSSLISYISSSSYHLNNEITIVYDVVSKCIVRTSFYGIL